MPINKLQRAQPREPHLALKLLTSHFSGSPVICPVYMARKIQSQNQEVTHQCQRSDSGGTVISNHLCTTWHQMAHHTLTKQELQYWKQGGLERLLEPWLVWLSGLSASL